jgi:hypothetical protein
MGEFRESFKRTTFRRSITWSRSKENQEEEDEDDATTKVTDEEAKQVEQLQKILERMNMNKRNPDDPDYVFDKLQIDKGTEVLDLLKTSRDEGNVSVNLLGINRKIKVDDEEQDKEAEAMTLMRQETQ